LLRYGRTSAAERGMHRQQHQEQEILALLTQRDESVSRLEEQLCLTSGESISNSLEGCVNSSNERL